MISSINLRLNMRMRHQQASHLSRSVSDYLAMTATGCAKYSGASTPIDCKAGFVPKQSVLGKHARLTNRPVVKIGYIVQIGIVELSHLAWIPEYRDYRHGAVYYDSISGLPLY